MKKEENTLLLLNGNVIPVFTLKPGTKIIEKTETYGDDDYSYTETYYELRL